MSKVILELPHQIEGIDWLWTIERGILADEMGLGKTKQVTEATKKFGSERVLGVMPNSLRRKWRDEIMLWTGASERDICIVEGWAEDREAQIKYGYPFTLLNYELIGSRSSWAKNDSGEWYQKKIDLRHLPTLESIKWDMIWADEAHRLSNRSSKAFESMKRINIRDRERPIIPITGTPLQNRPEELWPLLHLIDPKKYSTFWGWVEEWCHTQRPLYGSKHSREIIGVKDPETLKLALSQVMLRRRKKEVIGLPDSLINYIPVEMHPDQKDIYDSMESKLFAEVDGITVDAFCKLAARTRLKQICVAPQMIVNREEGLTGAKLDVTMDIIDGLRGDQYVIFSQFAKCVRGLTKLLNGRSKSPSVVNIHGDLNEDEREHNIKSWQAGKYQGLVCSMGCAAEGQDFVEAQNCIFTDVTENPQKNRQAAERLNRIGQKGQVTIHVPYCTNSIEEVILAKCQDKEDLFNDVIPEHTILGYLLESMQRK